MPTDVIQAMEFAQSKSQARQEGKTGVTFDDVAGIEYLTTELQDIVSVRCRPLLHPAAAQCPLILVSFTAANPARCVPSRLGCTVQCCMWQSGEWRLHLPHRLRWAAAAPPTFC